MTIPTVPTVTLNDGTSMPLVAFGSGTKHRGTDASKHIADAIKAGFRHIDCAQMYKNEESVGKGIVESGVPRVELYITTKLDRLPPGSTVRDALKVSLTRLRTDYVDMFLVHVPVVHDDLESVWRDMEACRLEGLTRSIGVSNFTPVFIERILAIATVPPAVNQIELHPYVLKASLPILEYSRKQTIVVSSWGGLSSIARFSGGPADPVLSRIATRHSAACGQAVTQAQVLQLWLRKKGIPYVTTTAKAERMAEYLWSLALPDITNEDEREINEAGSLLHRRFLCLWMDDVVDNPAAEAPRLD
ncbi:hypothetical protein NM688_g8343 [Phlebia brevispora]|uniref:Uncharacterized protein n=1 Tax=Phlebia brevispora TaxID=194682 RepID=A0ACC1RUD6_9APHY|nr:hypothetical protein NM688_g8343 [Phlebia brevispora]